MISDCTGNCIYVSTFLTFMDFFGKRVPIFGVIRWGMYYCC